MEGGGGRTLTHSAHTRTRTACHISSPMLHTTRAHTTLAHTRAHPAHPAQRVNPDARLLRVTSSSQAATTMFVSVATTRSKQRRNALPSRSMLNDRGGSWRPDLRRLLGCASADAPPDDDDDDDEADFFATRVLVWAWAFASRRPSPAAAADEEDRPEFSRSTGFPRFFFFLKAKPSTTQAALMAGGGGGVLQGCGGRCASCMLGGKLPNGS